MKNRSKQFSSTKVKHQHDHCGEIHCAIDSELSNTSEFQFNYGQFIATKKEVFLWNEVDENCLANVHCLMLS